ncbi:MAG TPA: ribosome biogenesis GTP-binding protein YihA/YsxC, partial [Candidatus Hydrogenedentes bacterium]|nr:ribosome biogenesis GTP-binding protein YihA/YsxC [Candidatus Hydrogenedentota bacterium]
MKVIHAEFITSAVRPDQYPAERRPEFAFVGRSNVGKSTLLNILLNRRGLAKTSKKPGKTRLINFFDVNGAVHFVDLPGYGFARVSKKERIAWERSITEYITGRDQLRLVMH